MFPTGAETLGWYGGRGVAATIDAFSNNLHIPAALTVLVIAAESFGAIGLIFGYDGSAPSGFLRHDRRNIHRHLPYGFS